MDLTRKIAETEEQYLWRIGRLVDSKQIENWSSVLDIVNKELLGEDEDKYRTESAWRKRYQAAKAFYDGCFSKMESEQYQKEIEKLNRELARKTIQYRDERNAWSRQNYADARVEETLNLLEEKLSEQGRANFATHDIPVINSDNDLLVCLADLHIGQRFKSVFGEYDSDIAQLRLQEYLNEIIRIGKLHNSKNVHIVSLGDQISGSIHKSIAITNKENVIEQIKKSIEYISSFCYELTKEFQNVFFYNVSGNHSRIDKKEDALHDERLDDLIGWDIARTLKHIDNFHSMDHRKLDIGIADISIYGKSYIAVHGDADSMTRQGAANLSMLLGFFPYGVVMGHKHHPAMSEFNGVKMIQSGSLAGSGDGYTIENRLCGKPNQTVCVCNNKGIQCIYNIELG